MATQAQRGRNQCNFLEKYTQEKLPKKSMGLRNNSLVVLWVVHLSVCQTLRDSWFLGAQSHNRILQLSKE